MNTTDKPDCEMVGLDEYQLGIMRTLIDDDMEPETALETAIGCGSWDV